MPNPHPQPYCLKRNFSKSPAAPSTDLPAPGGPVPLYHPQCKPVHFIGKILRCLQGP